MSEQKRDLGSEFTAAGKEVKGALTKQEQEEELEKIFRIRKTADFYTAPLDKKIAWLKHIVKNKDRYTKYHETWSDWLKDRGRDILEEKFDIRNTAQFCVALQLNKIEVAEECLKFIEENRDIYQQYDENWFADRRRELAAAQK